MPKTWPNALLLQFVDRESFETAYAEDVIITFEGHGFPDMPARPDDLDNAISARRIDLGSEITLLVKRFIGYRRDKYDNALLVELGGLIDIRLAIATGRIRLVPDATRDYELACELSEHQRRLQMILHSLPSSPCRTASPSTTIRDQLPGIGISSAPLYSWPSMTVPKKNGSLPWPASRKVLTRRFWMQD
jgi:hypothetical protein